MAQKVAAPVVPKAADLAALKVVDLAGVNSATAGPKDEDLVVPKDVGLAGRSVAVLVAQRGVAQAAQRGADLVVLKVVDRRPVPSDSLNTRWNSMRMATENLIEPN